MKQRELEFHKTYLRIAKEIGKLSYCERKKVGCLIVKDNNIISFGFNGTPSGTDNICEDINGETHWTVLHSESNAILKLATSTLSSENGIMYLTLSPCKNCAKLILQAKISKLFYINKHSDTSGLDFLIENGIQCYNISDV